MSKEYEFLRKMSLPYMPLVGRKQEIEYLLDTLYKTRMKNIVLVGEAGVGKTELVREVARIAKKMEPSWTFYELDLASLLSDTAYRGELEEKFSEDFKSLAREENTVLFCDEAHLLSSAGETQGEKNSLTVAQLLKPYLSSGQITLWGATTPSEFSESIGKDAALRRRLPEYRVESLGEEDVARVFVEFAKKIGWTNFGPLDLSDAVSCGSLEAGIEKIDRTWAHERRKRIGKEGLVG